MIFKFIYYIKDNKLDYSVWQEEDDVFEPEARYTEVTFSGDCHVFYMQLAEFFPVPIEECNMLICSHLPRSKRIVMEFEHV